MTSWYVVLRRFWHVCLLVHTYQGDTLTLDELDQCCTHVSDAVQQSSGTSFDASKAPPGSSGVFLVYYRAAQSINGCVADESAVATIIHRRGGCQLSPQKAELYYCDRYHHKGQPRSTSFYGASLSTWLEMFIPQQSLRSICVCKPISLYDIHIFCCFPCISFGVLQQYTWYGWGSDCSNVSEALHKSGNQCEYNEGIFQERCCTLWATNHICSGSQR